MRCETQLGVFGDDFVDEDDGVEMLSEGNDV